VLGEEATGDTAVAVRLWISVPRRLVDPHPPKSRRASEQIEFGKLSGRLPGSTLGIWAAKVSLWEGASGPEVRLCLCPESSA
jgi:hypothetical protein